MGGLFRGCYALAEARFRPFDARATAESAPAAVAEDALPQILNAEALAKLREDRAEAVEPNDVWADLLPENRIVFG